MGHYWSEMGDGPGYDVNKSEEAYAHKDELNAFWGDGRNNNCPRCGARVEWSYLDATNAFLHMMFHREDD